MTIRCPNCGEKMRLKPITDPRREEWRCDACGKEVVVWKEEE